MIVSTTAEAVPQTDHPITRLITVGPQALTSADLLSVVLQHTGRARPRAAATILATVDGSLRRLASDYATTLLAMRSVHRLRSARRHSVTLQAMFELGRRRAEEQLPAKPLLATTSALVALMGPRLRDLPVEEFHTLALNAHHFLERDITITRGILDATLVDPRAAFRQALAEQATSVVFVHNHPSGDPTPSARDRAVTAQLVAAGHILGVRVRDHVIIGQGRYMSFAESGWL